MSSRQLNGRPRFCERGFVRIQRLLHTSDCAGYATPECVPRPPTPGLPCGLLCERVWETADLAFETLSRWPLQIPCCEKFRTISASIVAPACPDPAPTRLRSYSSVRLAD